MQTSHRRDALHLPVALICGATSIVNATRGGVNPLAMILFHAGVMGRLLLCAVSALAYQTPERLALDIHHQIAV